MIYKVNEVSKILNISVWMTRKLLRTNEIKGKKVGKNYLVSDESLKKYIETITSGGV